MPRDSQTKLKKEQNKRSKKDDEKKRNKKINNDYGKFFTGIGSVRELLGTVKV